MAVNKPKAMSCELTCSQSSWLIAHNLGEKNKINIQETTACISNGCEQAHGHELWAHMLTYKLIDTSKFKWKEEKMEIETHSSIGSGCEQA